MYAGSVNLFKFQQMSSISDLSFSHPCEICPCKWLSPTHTHTRTHRVTHNNQCGDKCDQQSSPLAEENPIPFHFYP